MCTIKLTGLKVSKKVYARLFVVPATVPWSVLCERGKSENFDTAVEQSS